MEYSTAIALKNAGFPQGEHTPLSIPRMQIEEVEESYVKFPTTDDIIAELGEDLINIYRFENEWHCNFRMLKSDLGQSAWDSFGNTPREALANLYIELHSKA